MFPFHKGVLVMRTNVVKNAHYYKVMKNFTEDFSNLTKGGRNVECCIRSILNTFVVFNEVV